MKTDLIFAFRNIRKNATNSLITVLGLAIAIASCLIVYVYVDQEYNYNNFHKNAERIFRINYSTKGILGINKNVFVKPELIDLLKKQIPQIEYCTEYRSIHNMLEFENIFFDVQVGVASEDYFHMFTFKFIAGTKVNIFTKPYEIVLTKQLANKLFTGTKNYAALLGKAIRFPLYYGNTGFTIVGVMEDIPKNSTMNFDVIVSGKTGTNIGSSNNDFGYTSVFYMVNKNVDNILTSENVNHVVANYYMEDVKYLQNRNQLSKSWDAFIPFVLPLLDVYHNGEITPYEKTVSEGNFTILIIIAGLILVIACCNFIILSLGQYLKRIGEIGIRKVVGASKFDILKIFLSEGMIITFIALLLGGVFCYSFIPIFNKLSGNNIYYSLIDVRHITMFIIILIICIVILTSIIPVLVFSKVRPSQMAGKKINIGHKNILSQIFISFQYSVSIILIIVTLFTVRQFNYLKNKPLGFDDSNILNISIVRMTNDQKMLFKNLLAEQPGVVNLTLTDRDFIQGNSCVYISKGNGDQIWTYVFHVDHDYIQTLGLKVTEGRPFSISNETPNERSIIVNESFVKALGIETDPIGKSYYFYGVYFNIIGVVSDYHFYDMRQKISPFALIIDPNKGNHISTILLKYDPERLTPLIKQIKKCYEKVAPGKLFKYEFLDTIIKQHYDIEDRWGNIIGYASLIAIIISSLGLYGFTILLINQRFNEIGIRKVNGATSFEVMLNISKSFIGWLIVSLIISFPIAYFIVQDTLKNYANKVDISWWVFIIAGIIAFSVAMLTVSWQTWRASRKNPVEALKYE